MPTSGFDVTSISMPMAALLASLIGASATITASLIQLSIAWKRQAKEREGREPASKKARRGPVLAISVLVIASAVGGFALSQYLVTESRKHASALEAEIQEKLDRLSGVAMRLERATLASGHPLEVPVSEVDGLRNGEAQAVATVMLSACAMRTGESTSVGCSEQQAMRLELCAEVPAASRSIGVERYVRDEGDVRPWSQARMAPGQNPLAGAFAGEPVERTISDSHKQVCQAFHHWGGARTLRMVVTHVPSLPAQMAGTPHRIAE
jgi:hypothetical protein